ncbi:hypothetical protein AMIS_28740 [Actinoplanes missouriensis 431]|uniref:Uncharacterized protein n=1 Tax=Actinoplanes missouriensis (strain ATCC 14538 / DSM 43046 / CBS 188.64 / JCM 3121 / NBRC 102363 / NCIMB 12654 / NRRL B-3342 / UNCC 431) TaxID=512565 RepID=I0H507_ACTM4|nr:hypothetical protein [Actinoplanes missouriensis]BAL88094.1 hypothetical protein AMIS_28740 [Actinoplanes missouriensis 431]
MSEQQWTPIEETPEVAAAVRDESTVPELASEDAADESPEFVEPAEDSDPH